jgi:hypothetical protein
MVSSLHDTFSPHGRSARKWNHSLAVRFVGQSSEYASKHNRFCHTNTCQNQKVFISIDFYFPFNTEDVATHSDREIVEYPGAPYSLSCDDGQDKSSQKSVQIFVRVRISCNRITLAKFVLFFIFFSIFPGIEATKTCRTCFKK